ncbi:MAG: creatininase family protein [Rubellimicrobium sp.]|nr:creatininase family protein [Rubellimicrobium sp.]
MTPEVRLERLGPTDIRAAIAARPLVYLPLGTCEWHGEHLPVGLDALTAEAICTTAARRGGGLVFPVLHYGTGGGHGDYPWTIMVRQDQIEPLLVRSIQRLSDFGVTTVVLFSGHFAGEQIAMIDAVARDWNNTGSPLRVMSFAVSQATDCGIAPDHAALFETTLLAAIHPDLVRLDRLPDAPAADPGGNPMGPHRHDPSHPLYGIFGPDPRQFDLAAARPLLDRIVTWLLDAIAGGTR